MVPKFNAISRSRRRLLLLPPIAFADIFSAPGIEWYVPAGRDPFISHDATIQIPWVASISGEPSSEAGYVVVNGEDLKQALKRRVANTVMLYSVESHDCATGTLKTVAPNKPWASGVEEDV